MSPARRPTGRGPRRIGRIARVVGREGLRLIVAVVGFAVVVVGLIIGPIPGPGGSIVVLAGLTILATQFEWARRLLAWVKRRFREVVDRVRRRPDTTEDTADEAGGPDGILAP